MFCAAASLSRPALSSFRARANPLQFPQRRSFFSGYSSMYRAVRRSTRSVRRTLTSEAGGASEKKVMWLKTTTGLMVLGNVTYCLQLGGFLCTDPLMMRSFLVGGSSVFVVYALIQPTALLIPALWEGAFASIHAVMIYRLLSTDKVTLSVDELKVYGMVFQRHQLEVGDFTNLMKRGEWVTLKAGDKLTELEKPVDAVWIIVDGNVKVVGDDEHQSASDEIVLNPGQFVGEVSLLRDYEHKGAEPTKASATCVCANDVKCFRWARKDLFDFLETDESGRKVVETLFADVVDKFAVNLKHQWTEKKKQ
jgi:hypothetical protein